MARSRSSSVRLLPIGPDYVRSRAADEQLEPQRCRRRCGDVGQHLSLWYLSANPGRYQTGSTDILNSGHPGSPLMGVERRLSVAKFPGVPRRTFLKVGAAGGGLLLGFSLSVRVNAAPTVGDATQEEFAPDGFVRIDREGRVTLVMPQVEMGQGTYTSMSMLIAEELEVNLERVTLEAAPPDDRLYANALIGSQVTGGSTSVRAMWQPLRRAGAAARIMLITAAGRRWHVDPMTCRAENGEVIHRPTGQRLTYGALVDSAARLPGPADVPPKDPKDFKLIGTPAKRLDTPDKVNGKAQFGIDVRLPGMKIATVAACPVFGGKLSRVDESAALAIEGVRQVVRLEDAVAVVADHMWAALQGVAGLDIDWDEGRTRKCPAPTLRGRWRSLRRSPVSLPARRAISPRQWPRLYIRSKQSTRRPFSHMRRWSR